MSQGRKGKGSRAPAEVVPDEFRCKRSDGKQWRCSARAVEGKSMCEKHIVQAKKRAAGPITGTGIGIAPGTGIGTGIGLGIGIGGATTTTAITSKLPEAKRVKTDFKPKGKLLKKSTDVLLPTRPEELDSSVTETESDTETETETETDTETDDDTETESDNPPSQSKAKSLPLPVKRFNDASSGLGVDPGLLKVDYGMKPIPMQYEESSDKNNRGNDYGDVIEKRKRDSPGGFEKKIREETGSFEKKARDSTNDSEWNIKFRADDFQKMARDVEWKGEADAEEFQRKSRENFQGPDKERVKTDDYVRKIRDRAEDSSKKILEKSTLVMKTTENLERSTMMVPNDTKRKMKEKNQDSALKFTDHARGQLNGGFYGSNAKVRNI